MPATRCILEFNRFDPNAVRYARNQSSRLVTAVTNDVRRAIRSVIAEAVGVGVPPRVAARILRDIVGLDRRDATAIAKMIRDMKRAGASASTIEKRVAVRTKKMLRRRSLLIARTETLRSANAGQTELWRQAKKSGELASNVRRVWIVTPDERLRKSHFEIMGQVVPIDQSFHRLDGVVIEPGGEPNCRCVQGIATPEDISRAKRKGQYV